MCKCVNKCVYQYMNTGEYRFMVNIDLSTYCAIWELGGTFLKGIVQANKDKFSIQILNFKEVVKNKRFNPSQILKGMLHSLYVGKF